MESAIDLAIPSRRPATRTQPQLSSSLRLSFGCLAGVIGDEVRHLDHLADLDLDVADHIREARGPFDGLVLGLHLYDREAGDQLLRLCERPIRDRALAARELEPRAPGARVNPRGREQHA